LDIKGRGFGSQVVSSLESVFRYESSLRAREDSFSVAC
jgi:hypothetical protein